MIRVIPLTTEKLGVLNELAKQIRNGTSLDCVADRFIDADRNAFAEVSGENSILTPLLTDPPVLIDMIASCAVAFCAKAVSHGRIKQRTKPLKILFMGGGGVFLPSRCFKQ